MYTYSLACRPIDDDGLLALQWGALSTDCMVFYSTCLVIKVGMPLFVCVCMHVREREGKSVCGCTTMHIGVLYTCVCIYSAVCIINVCVRAHV